VKKKKVMFMFVVLALLAVSSFAQTAPAPAAPYEPLSGAHQEGVRWGLVSAAFVLGIAAAAGAIGQGRAVAAACEGIARNPSAAPAIRLAMIIGLALIESLVIYALIIAFVAVGK
jgi:F-type H+-transporting ATPase subunit c